MFSNDEVVQLQKIATGELELYDLPAITYDKVYRFFVNDMPHGIQKDDPDSYIFDHWDSLLNTLPEV